MRYKELELPDPVEVKFIGDRTTENFVRATVRFDSPAASIGVLVSTWTGDPKHWRAGDDTERRAEMLKLGKDISGIDIIGDDLDHRIGLAALVYAKERFADPISEMNGEEQ